MRGGRTRPRDLRSQGPRFRVNRPAVSVNRGGARTARRRNTPRERAAESCKARGRNRANVRLHVREMSAGARLVRPPKIRRSLVKQGDPGSRSRTARPRSRPGSARGRGFRRPSAGPSSAVHPALDRPSAGPRRVCRRGPENGPSSPTTRPADLRPLPPSPLRPKGPPRALPRWLFTTEMHPITLGGNRGFLGARIGSRPTLRRLCAEKSPTAAPIGRPEASTIPATRAPGARGATKNGGPHNACPRRLFPNVQPDKCAFCPRELAGFRRGRGVRRKTGGAQRMPAPTFPERAAGQMPTFEPRTNPLHQL